MGEKERTGSAVGAATGAVLGGVIGAATGHRNQREKVAVGAAVGAAVGGLAGNRIGAYMDRQERDLRQAMQTTIAQNTATVQRNSEQVLTATFRSDVFFDVDSATLKPGAYSELDRVAGVLNRYPQTLIRVEGHTDQTGGEVYNLRLSERRADSVRSALVQRGIDPGRITSAGMGECCPNSSGLRRQPAGGDGVDHPDVIPGFAALPEPGAQGFVAGGLARLPVQGDGFSGRLPPAHANESADALGRAGVGGFQIDPGSAGFRHRHDPGRQGAGLPWGDSGAPDAVIGAGVSIGAHADELLGRRRGRRVYPATPQYAPGA